MIERLRRFFHDYLRWHRPSKEIGFDGCSRTSVCIYCGCHVLQDSQGKWFTTGRV
jgi:hypothetical protein